MPDVSYPAGTGNYKFHVILVSMMVTNLTRRIVLVDHCAIADTPQSKRTGLLTYDTLPPGHGLLLTAPTSRVHTHGMRFPIDLVFVNRTGKVTRTVREVGQGRVEGNDASCAVLEVPVGTVEGTGTVAGDQLEIC
jgi:uncharacterized membrane protein (UPF0127 family)